MRADLAARVEAFTKFSDFARPSIPDLSALSAFLRTAPKVEFGPARASLLRKKRQTFAVALVFLQPVLSALLSAGLLLRGGALARLLFVAYVAWLALLDRAPRRGGRLSAAARRSVVWRWVADYFPVSLVKTTDLDPRRNYLFGYHPHGIISVGAITNFATDATGFSELFPGVALRVATLSFNFKIPFFRELLLACGVVDASAASIAHCCDARRGPGASCMVVIGGARESLNAQPGTQRLVLAERKGFVKVALRAGASLVPVFAFGENDLFDQAAAREGGLARRVQVATQRLFGFTARAAPLEHGGGGMKLRPSLVSPGAALLGAEQGRVGRLLGPGRAAAPARYRERRRQPRARARAHRGADAGADRRVPPRAVHGRAPVTGMKLSPPPPPAPPSSSRYHAQYLDALRAIWDDHKDELALEREDSLVFQ